MPTSRITSTAGSQTIAVIVHGTRTEVDALAARYNLRVARYLKSGAVLRLTAGQLAALSDDQAVEHLSGDVRFRASEVTAESIGADQVWAGSEGLPALTGAGIAVAVIDSGIDFGHDALKKRVIATVDFTGGTGQDAYGHGTHVAAIIAGQRGRTADTADYRGIAPGAFIVNLRVLGADGSGYASDVVEAIDWAIEHRKAYNIKVINLSLGTPVLQPYRDDPVCEAVERAIAAGMVVVVAAGNNGQTLDGQAHLRRDHVAGQPSGRDHGWRGRHARDAASGPTTPWRRTARAVRPGSTWRSSRIWWRRAATSCRPKRRARIWRRRIHSGTWRARAPTPTCSCRGPAWRRAW